jgi:PilZ domain
MLTAVGTDLIPNQPLGMNTRRWTREKLEVPIRVILHRPDRTIVADGRGAAVSEGGMCVRAGIELALGVVANVEFTPSYTQPLRVCGVVRNRDGFNYGIEFFQSAGQVNQIEELRQFLRSASGL